MRHQRPATLPGPSRPAASGTTPCATSTSTCRSGGPSSIAGVSGSGKTSLAMGTLYAEGLHRFLEGLSTYSRRRLTQDQRPDADRIDHLPPALALRQRPPVPGPRSTVGTMSEVLNVLRLIMSRLGTHRCPNGHDVPPSIATQAMEIQCPVDGVRFEAPERGVVRVQLDRGLPGLQRHRHPVRGRPGHARPGPGPGRSTKVPSCRGTWADAGCRCTPPRSSVSGSTSRTRS